MRIQPQITGKISVDSNRAIYLSMPFSSAIFNEIYQLKFIPNSSSIYGIDLVYTKFKEIDSFNQPKLNLKRFAELKKIYPSAFNEGSIVWRVLEQREAKTKENAEKCFHGFVVYLKNNVPDSITRKEIATIKSILHSYKDTLIWIPERIEYKIKKIKIETGNYLPKSEKKRKAGIRFKNRGIWLRQPEYVVRKDSIVKKRSGAYYKKVSNFDTTFFRSTDEFKTLTRIKWSPKMAVVADVTGSMTPFSAQIMLWIKYNPDMLKFGRFTFFNDGDNTPDAYKKTGTTGGIYFAQSENFDSIFNVMEQTMAKGLGGDLPENNLEAVIKTIQHWPDTDTILLIADNNAQIKDLSLLPLIKKPISVMCCGAINKINADYINVANKTGGRLFVLNQEIKNLKGLKNGNRITIGKSIFEYQKGALIRMK